ncbi:MAG: thiol-disulfide oxidoreductase DCC family protein [Bacteroidia bacterium]
MKPEKLVNSDNNIVLFDGVCNFCNSSINFIIRNDKKGYFKFAPLQSELAQKLVGDKTKPVPESVILIENGKLYDRSSAALRIAKKLDGLWPIFYIFIIIPKPIRDMVYNFIGRNRYKWFGKTETCMIPSPEVKGRFLDTNVTN